MNNSIGSKIAELRKKNGMTQADLAEKLGITDKAVSKWERNLSCPDITTIPRISEIFGVSVDELMQCERVEGKEGKEDGARGLVRTILRAVPLAMGVAVVVLSIMKKLDAGSAISMLGLGLACISVSSFVKDEDE